MYALAMETARSFAKLFRLVIRWPFRAMDWTRWTLQLRLRVFDLSDQNSVNRRLGNDILVFQNKIPILKIPILKR